MGLTRRKWTYLKNKKNLKHKQKRSDGSYYVEFYVVDDGKVLHLAPPKTGKLKRWRVGAMNKRAAQEQESVIKTKLLTGQILSPALERTQNITFRAWAETYLGLEEVKRLATYEDRKLKVSHLVEYFGDRLLSSISPEDVARYRAERVRYSRTNCGKCGKPLGRAVCLACGWKRTDSPLPVSVQTINHDHTALNHMLNVACSPRFKLIHDNPARHVEKPDPKNERDRIASADEWAKLRATAAPHLLRFLSIAYAVGPRKGELLKLEWPDVDIRRKEFTLRNTKNGETRVVPMTPDVFDTFVELHEERRLDTQRVFLYNGKPWKNPRTAFAAACRRAGITGLRLHDLRHCAATNLRRAGVDTMTAMKIIGHKSEQMHRRYNSIKSEDLHEAAEKLHRYRTNTLLTLASSAASEQCVSDCNSNVGA
ncbi:MAG: site-specific integrase [Nitrospira sp.]|nr:site-specific integrase [Nitrospira sp.]